MPLRYVTRGVATFTACVRASVARIEVSCPRALVGLDIGFEDVPSQLAGWVDRVPLASAVGARPLALVNCLNFGNPEHPEVMWQLSSTVDGMAGACTAMDLPVVGGNVSLYNTSGGRNIDPTPVVTTLGLIERAVQEAAQAPSLSAALEIGYLAFGEAACTAAAREGIAAFGEKRAPDFARVG